MYLKSTHETICFGSWMDEHKSHCFPCGHIPDLNQTPTFPVTHHVNEQLPQRLQEEMTTEPESGSVRRKDGNAVCLLTNCGQTLPSALAHRSHTAFRTAAVARWITPFSGPSWFRQEVKSHL